jgi:hypothetical protein
MSHILNRSANTELAVPGGPPGSATKADANSTSLITTEHNVSVPTDDLPMSAAEFQRLDQLETQIKGKWQQIALDCKEIRELKLYRRTRDGARQTWGEYCKRFQGQSKQYVDKTIRAAEVIQSLEMETKVSEFPVKISHAAPLFGLQPIDMAKATEAAFETAKSEKRKVTSEDFAKAAKTLKPAMKTEEMTSSQSGHDAGADPPAQHLPIEVLPIEVLPIEVLPIDVLPVEVLPVEVPPIEHLPNKTTSVVNYPGEPTGSVGLHINSTSLIAPVTKFFELFGLTATSSETDKGTVFTFEGSAKDQQNLLNTLVTLLADTGPLDMRITLD